MVTCGPPRRSPVTPARGVRNCVRWAQIDPTQISPAPDQLAFPLDASSEGVVQAGVFGSDFGYRSFPSIGVNSCGDMGGWLHVLIRTRKGWGYLVPVDLRRRTQGRRSARGHRWRASAEEGHRGLHVLPEQRWPVHLEMG